MSSQNGPYNHPYDKTAESLENIHNSQELEIFEQNPTNNTPTDYFSPIAPYTDAVLAESDIDEVLDKVVTNEETKGRKEESHHAAVTHSGPLNSENQASSASSPHLRKSTGGSPKSPRQLYEMAGPSAMNNNEIEAEETAHTVTLSRSTPKNVNVAGHDNHITRQPIYGSNPSRTIFISHRRGDPQLTPYEERLVHLIELQYLGTTTSNTVIDDETGETLSEALHRTIREAQEYENRQASAAAKRRDFWAAIDRAEPVTKRDRMNKRIRSARASWKSWNLCDAISKIRKKLRKASDVSIPYPRLMSYDEEELAKFLKSSDNAASVRPDSLDDERLAEDFRSIENAEEATHTFILDGHLAKIMKVAQVNNESAKEASGFKDKREGAEGKAEKQKGPGRVRKLLFSFFYHR